MSATPLVYFQSGPQLRLSTHTHAASCGRCRRPPAHCDVVDVGGVAVGCGLEAVAGGGLLRWTSPDPGQPHTPPPQSHCWRSLSVCALCVWFPRSATTINTSRRRQQRVLRQSPAVPQNFYLIFLPPDGFARPVTDTGACPCCSRLSHRRTPATATPKAQ